MCVCGGGERQGTNVAIRRRRHMHLHTPNPTATLKKMKQNRAIVADPIGHNMVYLALRCKGDVAVSTVSDYYKAKHNMVETLLPQTRPGGQSEFEVRESKETKSYTFLSSLTHLVTNLIHSSP